MQTEVKTLNHNKIAVVYDEKLSWQILKQQ